jgi:signal transduction histidine kinase
MTQNESPRNGAWKVVPASLSIKQRLPLLICVLLLCVIITYSITSYYSIRKASMEMGKERLKSLTNQLSAILGQSTGTLVTNIKNVADNDTLRQCLLQSNESLQSSAVGIIKKLKTDSTTVLVELLDKNYSSVLHYTESKKEWLQPRLSEIWKNNATSRGPSVNTVGKIYSLNNSMYFPVIAAVTENKQVIGYLVSWRLLTSTPQAIEMLNQLMGKGTTLYVGNADGSFWTDMVKPAKDPLAGTKESEGYYAYDNIKGKSVMAAVHPVNNSRWQVLIEISMETILEGANRFMKWVIFIGAILIVAGIVIAWFMSKNITRPLHELTQAAIGISKGNMTKPVKIDRRDELGELSNAFNIMSEKVMTNQLNLEKKVAQRTEQLENVNRELEAFSYSVSHDLRAPLRIITGYTTMLEEKFQGQLDDETKRITHVIKSNAYRMGQLIDDLLDFARVSRENIVKTKIETNKMVEEIIAALNPKDKDIQWNIGTLEPVAGDVNMIKQVWINLISNAIKYSRKQEQPVIETGSFNDGNEVVFFVKDNGAGFNEKYKDKLFKVFQRLHSATEFEGSGVGLAIVEKIVSKHGGRVWAESAVNQGASFYFSLP